MVVVWSADPKIKSLLSSLLQELFRRERWSNLPKQKQQKMVAMVDHLKSLMYQHFHRELHDWFFLYIGSNQYTCLLLSLLQSMYRCPGLFFENYFLIGVKFTTTRSNYYWENNHSLLPYYVLGSETLKKDTSSFVPSNEWR